MNETALGYLVYQFFYRIFDFFRHWYADGSRMIAYGFIATLEDIDRSFAIKITLQHFFEPLYKDYSIVGRVLGIVFRSVRIAMGAIVYLVVALCFLVGYLAWVSIPLVILFFAIARTGIF